MPDPSITDWISAISSALAALVAAVAAYLAYKQYLQPPAQEPEPDEAVAETTEAEHAKVVVFRTKKQKTYFKITERGLECHLEDDRAGKGGHQWTLSKGQSRDILANNDYSVNPGFKARSGTFSLGPRKNWLYSKVLYPEPDYLHGTLHDLLTRASSA